MPRASSMPPKFKKLPLSQVSLGCLRLTVSSKEKMVRNCRGPACLRPKEDYQTLFGLWLWTLTACMKTSHAIQSPRLGLEGMVPYFKGCKDHLVPWSILRSQAQLQTPFIKRLMIILFKESSLDIGCIQATDGKKNISVLTWTHSKCKI